MKTIVRMCCIIAFAACVVGGMAGCKKSVASKGELNIFTWQEYVPDVLWQNFEKETGIKVNYSYFSTNEEMLAKLEAVNGGQYDIVVCGDYIIDIMRSKGNLLHEIDSSRLSNYGNINPMFQSKFYDPQNVYTIPYTVMFPGILYDAQETSLTFTTLDQLADPSLKNKVVVFDDPRGVIGIGLAVNGFSWNEMDPANLARAQHWLAGFRQNIKAFNYDDPEGLVVNGEAAVSYANAAQAVAGVERDPSLKIAYPEGIYTQEDNIIIPARAPNLDNAYTFIDYVLEGKNAAIIERDTHYQSCNRKAAENRFEGALIAIAPDEVLAHAEALQNVGDATEIYDRIWTEFK